MNRGEIVENTDLYNEFKSLGSDTARWLWVKGHQKQGVVVYCDNDDTFIVIGDDERCESFDNYIGWSDGIFNLLDVLEIKAESV